MAESDISLHDHGRSPAKNDAALTHARRLILRVCHLAGTAAFIDEAGLGPEGKDLRKAIRSRNTAALFDLAGRGLELSRHFRRGRQELYGPPRPRVVARDRKRPARDGQAARSSEATGTFTTAGTTRAGSPAPSPTTSRIARCRDPGCATAGSIRPPIRCICSFATSLTATWSAGSTGA